jgi:hypothetical protein
MPYVELLVLSLGSKNVTNVTTLTPSPPILMVNGGTPYGPGKVLVSSQVHRTLACLPLAAMALQLEACIGPLLTLLWHYTACPNLPNLLASALLQPRCIACKTPRPPATPLTACPVAFCRADTPAMAGLWCSTLLLANRRR